jgi:hypothetical protein
MGEEGALKGVRDAELRAALPALDLVEVLVEHGRLVGQEILLDVPPLLGLGGAPPEDEVRLRGAQDEDDDDEAQEGGTVLAPPQEEEGDGGDEDQDGQPEHDEGDGPARVPLQGEELPEARAVVRHRHLRRAG